MISLLSLLASPAEACDMFVYPPTHVTLPGETAGPEAVFTVIPVTELLDSSGAAVEVSRLPLPIGLGEALELLVPLAPLVPGDYTLSPCLSAWPCTTTIVDGAGDPGVLPAMPAIAVERTHVLGGGQADCGPRLPAQALTATTDAVGVVFAEEPAADLLDLVPIGVGQPDENGDPRWTTTWDGTVFAAAIDAEGEISEWTEAIDVQSHGCSTRGSGPMGGILVMSALLLSIRWAGRPPLRD